MLGARRKVNSPIADACRLSICVSTLVLDTKDRFIDDLFRSVASSQDLGRSHGATESLCCARSTDRSSLLDFHLN